MIEIAVKFRGKRRQMTAKQKEPNAINNQKIFTAPRMLAPTIQKLLQSANAQTAITARGWVRTTRKSKNVAFFELSDGSTSKGLQCVVDRRHEIDLTAITVGSSVTVRGRLVPSMGTQQHHELHVDAVAVVGPADPHVRFRPVRG
jgi:aspartyl/asparaginyl-tRNA synthetase